MKLSINPDDMTLGDMEDFEDATGVSLSKALSPVPVLDENGNRVLDDKGRPVKEANVTAKSLIALVWITTRRTNPEFTLADARNVKVTELEFVEQTEGDQGNG